MKSNFVLVDFVIFLFDELLNVKIPWWWKHVIVHLTSSTSRLLCEKDINFAFFWDVTLCGEIEIYHDSSKTLINLCQIICHHTKENAFFIITVMINSVFMRYKQEKSINCFMGSLSCRGDEWVGLYLHFSYTPLWHAQRQF